MPGTHWTDEELRWLADHPSATYADYRLKGWERSYDAWRFKRAAIRSPLTPIPGQRDEGAPLALWDKAEGRFDWRRANQPIAAMQAMRRESKRSQHEGRVVIPAEREVPVICLSDTHIGAWSTDHDLLESITDQILAQPDLRIFLLGDIANAAIKLRGVAEVKDDILPPDLQVEYLRSWLDEIAPRVLCAVWGNHDAMREEDAVGYSRLADLQAERTIYSSGIAHLDLTVGEQDYRLALSHRYRWRSQDNPCHGPSSYIRREAPDRDVCIAGDSHVPGVLEFAHAGRKRIAVNCGSTQTGSGYAKRWFSLTTLDVFPVLVFDPEEYAPRAYWSLAEYRREAA